MIKNKFILILLLLLVYSFGQDDIIEPFKILKGHEYTVLCLDIDETGKYIVSGSYDTDVILWDYDTGEKLKTFKGHNSGVWKVKISPDSKYLASGSWDNNRNAIGSSQNCLNILDLKTLELIKSLSIYPDRYKTRAFITELDGSSANGIYETMFNDDASKIAALSRSGDLFIWNIKDDFKGLLEKRIDVLKL